MQLSAGALAQITTLLQGPNPQYASAYSVAYQDLIANYPNATGSDADVLLFLQDAQQINSGAATSVSIFVRANNIAASGLLLGTAITLFGSQNQTSSNAVASAFFNGVNGTGGVIANDGNIPTFQQIANIDAQNGLAALGLGQYPEAWAGSMPDSAQSFFGFTTNNYYDLLNANQQHESLIIHEIALGLATDEEIGLKLGLNQSTIDNIVQVDMTLYTEAPFLNIINAEATAIQNGSAALTSLVQGVNSLLTLGANATQAAINATEADLQGMFGVNPGINVPTDVVDGGPDIDLNLSASSKPVFDVYVSSLDGPVTVSGGAAVPEDLTFLDDKGEAVLDDTANVTGTISNFALGDSIDLAGISATGATLGVDNLLTVQESGGASASIQFDPAQNLSGINFQAFPDGSGGTDIAPDSLVALSGSAFSISTPSSDTAGTFSLINPATGAVDASGAQFPGTVLSEGGAAGDGKFYFEAADSTTQQLSLYTVDIQTGAVLSKVPTTDEDPFVVDDLTGELVGMSGSMLSLSSPSSDTAGTFSVINPATGVVNAFGASFPGLQLVLGGAAVNGMFYFAAGVPNTGQLSLNTIDIESGTLLNQVPFTDEETFVADNLTGELVGMTGSKLSFSSPSSDTAGTFSVIDPATGAVNAFGASFPGLELTDGGTAADGKFYFTAGNPNTGQEYLCTIDIVTGQLLSEVATTQQSFVADQPFTCFLMGTYIGGAYGEIAVHELAVGDLVQAQDARLAPVKWIGHRRVDCRRHPKPYKVWPVCVRTCAFGEGMPHRDLWLSPDHAVFVDDVLIPIKHLINGTSIAQVPVDEATYYHIELEHHDVLLAEGLPAESYLDTGDRSNFENGGGPITLHPEFSARRWDNAHIWEALACARLIVTGPELDAVRQQVNALAAVTMSPRGGETTRAA